MRRWNEDGAARRAASRRWRSAARRLAQLVREAALGSVVGVMAGGAAAGFLVSLDWVTRTRDHHHWLLFGLPLAGFATGLAYHAWGATAAAGSTLILDEINEPRAWIPRR
ncbi:MAG: voltage gated chloride channel family protein, partial [Acidimicrobiales bacterium]|nr:voltage gated chloride channel family protein [Acidimicrobiales bacterium]